MSDIDKRNDPDVVVRIRWYLGPFDGNVGPLGRGLLTEAADTIAELRAELAAADAAIGELYGAASVAEGHTDSGMALDALHDALTSTKDATMRARRRMAEARRLGLLGEVEP